MPSAESRARFLPAARTISERMVSWLCAAITGDGAASPALSTDDSLELELEELLEPEDGEQRPMVCERGA